MRDYRPARTIEAPYFPGVVRNSLISQAPWRRRPDSNPEPGGWISCKINRLRILFARADPPSWHHKSRLIPAALLAFLLLACGPSDEFRDACQKEHSYLVYQVIEVRPEWLTPEMIEDHEARCGDVLGLDRGDD